jgi:hypothetical protein
MYQRATFWSWLLAWVAALAAPQAAAQQWLFHDPFLNWDFVNLTETDANDFEIVVATPNWSPPQTYTGFFPNFTTKPEPVSGGTLLSWSGTLVPPGGIAHVGAAMQGSGRILDAYWTLDGQKVGQSLAIVYELTQIFPLASGGEAIAMNLQVAPAFEGQAGLANIRTFRDLPADLLGLDELTRELAPRLNEPPLSELETEPAQLLGVDFSGGNPTFQSRPLPEIAQLPTGDSFFDVFVEPETFNVGARFESLLVADVVVWSPTLQEWQPIGQFWNLNPQSPEPTSAILLAIGGAAALGRGRRARGQTCAD